MTRYSLLGEDTTTLQKAPARAKRQVGVDA